MHPCAIGSHHNSFPKSLQHDQCNSGSTHFTRRAHPKHILCYRYSLASTGALFIMRFQHRKFLHFHSAQVHNTSSIQLNTMYDSSSGLWQFTSARVNLSNLPTLLSPSTCRAPMIMSEPTHTSSGSPTDLKVGWVGWVGVGRGTWLTHTSLEVSVCFNCRRWDRYSKKGECQRKRCEMVKISCFSFPWCSK